MDVEAEAGTIELGTYNPRIDDEQSEDLYHPHATNEKQSTIYKEITQVCGERLSE